MLNLGMWGMALAFLVIGGGLAVGALAIVLQFRGEEREREAAARGRAREQDMALLSGAEAPEEIEGLKLRVEALEAEMAEVRGATGLAVRRVPAPIVQAGGAELHEQEQQQATL